MATAGGLEPDLSNLTLPGGLSAAGLMAALGAPAECHGGEPWQSLTLSYFFILFHTCSMSLGEVFQSVWV